MHVLITKLAKISPSEEQKGAVMVDSVRMIKACSPYTSLISDITSGGPEGLRALTNAKAIIVDRWPFLIQTAIPSALDYPIRSLPGSW